MPNLRRWIVPLGASLLVAVPLLYFHIVGRQAPLIVGYCGAAGPIDTWRYGWPAIYGTRTIEEPWLGRPGTVGPLKTFNASAVFWNLCAAAIMIAATAYVATRIASVLQTRQFSLRGLMLLPVVTLLVCVFVKYERCPTPHFFFVPSTPAHFDPSADAIVFRPQTITDFPPYLYLPIIIGVASASFAAFSLGPAIVMSLCRMAICVPDGSSRRRTSRRLLASIALIGLLLAAIWTARSAHRFRAACHADVSGRLAAEWVAWYVNVHEEWPRSWDAIRTCLREHSSWWPHKYEDEDELIEMARAYIAIDFQADAREVANQTVEHFDAIRTLDQYGTDHRDYWQVDLMILLVDIDYKDADVEDDPAEEDTTRTSYGSSGTPLSDAMD